MEVAPCIQKASRYAASLLKSLQLQREQAQFCDCVVRQRQNPGQLYPAHRCVLAASSPVLASILSSTGALVELQAPCLPDSVLAPLLDYIYTGALPYTHSQEQYYNLLTAANYLQMDELQEALRAEVNSKTMNTFSKYLPLSHTCSVNSLERLDQYCDEIDASSSKNSASHCGTKDTSPLNSLKSTSCSMPESTTSSLNTDNCRQVTYLTPQDLIQNIPCAAEIHRVSTVDKEVQGDQFQSAGSVKPEGWQRSTEEDLVGIAENRGNLYSLCTAEVQEAEQGRAEKTRRLCLRGKSEAEEKQDARKEEDNIHHSPLHCLSTSHLKDNVSPSQSSSSSCLSSQHPCCEAVPVIRHSSTATMAEVSTVPPYHPISQASVSRAPDSRSGSTDNGRIVEDITTKHKNQDYDSNNTDHNEHMGIGLSHITDDNDHHAHCDSFQNHTKHLRDGSIPPNKDGSSFTRGLKHITNLRFDDFPFKHQQLDCFDCHRVSTSTAAEEQSVHSQDLRAVVPLPVQDSDTGSDSHCEDLCPEGEAKEEHSYSSRCPSEMERQGTHCNPYGPENDWYPILRRAEMSTKDAPSSQHEQDYKDTAMDVTPSLSALNCHTSREDENVSGTELSESHLMPVDNNVFDPKYSVVEQSYHGHLHYHCLPQEDTHCTHRDSDLKYSHPSHPDHSDQSSDEEGEEVGTFASPGVSPLRQHFATTDQVLLLDISTKPAELLVSYRHRYDEGKERVAFDQKNREQQNEATSVAGVDGNNIRARIIFGAKSFDESETKSWVGETNVEERKSVGKEESRAAEVIHKAGGVESENQTTTMTHCSPPSVPETVKVSMSPTLSGCIPCTLSASMPTNISAHLSTPVHHPFQCSLCDRSFSQRGSLNRHVRSHLGVRPFPCPRCPMTFSRQYRVTEHMRVHQRCVLRSDFQKPPASSI